jgi:hypothetical protein
MAPVPGTSRNTHRHSDNVAVSPTPAGDLTAPRPLRQNAFEGHLRTSTSSDSELLPRSDHKGDLLSNSGQPFRLALPDRSPKPRACKKPVPHLHQSSPQLRSRTSQPSLVALAMAPTTRPLSPLEAVRRPLGVAEVLR